MTAKLIDEATEILRQANAEARRLEEQRFFKLLKDYVQDDKRRFQFGGMVNAITTLAQVAEELWEGEEEGTECERDYRFAERVLEAAAEACDLRYGERSSERARKGNLECLEKAIQQIKP